MPGESEVSLNELLIEQLNVNMANISSIIEKEGQQLFGQSNLLSNEEITEYTLEFLELFVKLLQADSRIDRRRKEFKALREFFTNFSQQLQLRGGDLSEFVRYVQFLQRVFLENLQEDQRLTFQQSRELLLQLASVFNDITLDVFNVYLEEKERTITAQQEELRETSTPITEIWDGVLTLPIIGTLDSSRTMTVMEKLLARIEADRAKVVVMDVTGVTAIDSQISHHLIQMMRAIGLMGADAILTGIRPEIARAMTNLEIDLGGMITRSTLSEGLKEAFRRLGIHVSPARGDAGETR
ncbi:STAS domain-containing protein [Thiohalorhabdus sp.]|uniref:STAS domain-containing protein n=1 Tax=Thiohalorhabdus sp. TaxID=3094134 RepID=UPI002FC2F230